VNVILVIIDTLRYDYATSPRLRRAGIADALGLGADTPNLDKLAERSWVFDNSYTASFPTIPHRTDVMTGLAGGPFHPWLPLRHDAVTLPWTLGEAGYATQLIHDTPHLVNGGHNFDWPFQAWTQIRGAEVDRPWITDSRTFPENWQADPIFDGIEGDPWEVNLIPAYVRANRNRKTLDDWNAAKTFSTAAAFLRDNASRERFFLWVDEFDPHEPWDAPREFMKMYVDEAGYDGRIDPRSFLLGRDLPEPVVARVRAAFAAKVSWMDHCFGKLLDAMDANGLWENTAIVLTADHGTRLYERGKFSKGGLPHHEEVTHTPFMVYAPGAGAGRTDMIVQPQDIFATVCALAGVDVPEGVTSHDVLSLARAGKPSPRKIALTGTPAGGWERLAEAGPLFNAFDGEWRLDVHLKAAECGLSRMGSLEDVAADHPDVVARLHAEALDEIERRGTDPALVAWLRGAGETDFPAEARFFENWPAPAGFRAYFSRLCHD